MLSVIIPVFNMEVYIEKCISEILKEKNIDIEILVIDYGSSDSTIQKVKNIDDTDNVKIKIFDKVSNDVAEARNVGIEKAKNKYINFLDADDWIGEKYFSTLIESMEKENLDICYTDYINYINDDKENIIKNFDIKKIDKDINQYNKSLFDSIISCKLNCEAWNKIYRVNFLKENKLYFDNTKGVNGEDLLFNLLIIMYNPKIGYVENIYYYHLIRNNSLGNLLKKEVNERFIYLVNKVQEEYSKRNLLKYNERNISKMFVNLMFQDMYKHTSSKEISECKKIYFKLYKNKRKVILNLIDFKSNFKRKFAILLLLFNMDNLFFKLRRRS